ncbi:MAG: hypothetical protein ACR2KJ_03465 [Jatrophihabitans sp.]
MTKRRDALKKISKSAKTAGLEWKMDREGAKHSIYILDGLVIPVPRHAELGNLGAEMLYRECEEKLGEGWWRK